MIPADWSPVHRADGEPVGWLDADGHPRLLTGALLPGPPDGAEDLLRARALAALDRRWWARLPAPLPKGLLAAGDPQEDWTWQPVVLVESSPAGCTVRPEWPAPGETGRAVLPVPVPVGHFLREEPPA